MTNSLELRHIELRVPNLARSLGFYVDQIGLVAVHCATTGAELALAPGADPILALKPDSRAVAPPAHAAGLFHAALRFPNRVTLGAWLRRAAQHGVEFDGFSDHQVSEALYFHDPDGNGLEFYADRSREFWPMQGDQVEMVTRPLDVQSLLDVSSTNPNPPLAGCRWGHLHLRVTNLDQSERFYVDALGLRVTQRNYPGARFLAADGYHHHLGLNSWGHPRVGQPADALGLAAARFAHRQRTAGEFRDPDGISVHVVPF